MGISTTQEIKRNGKFEKRIVAIDLTRGICMFLVFFDHIMWHLSYYFSDAPGAINWAGNVFGQSASNPGFAYYLGEVCEFYYANPYRMLVRFLALAAFLFISGVSSAFSKDNNKRAIKMVAFWFVLMIGSNIINSFWGSGSAINFNVIGVVGFSVLFYCLIQRRSWKIILAATLFLIIFWLYVMPPLYEMTIGKGVLVYPLWLPDSVYVNGDSYYQADYMPLFPFIIVFFIGVLFSLFFYKNPKEHLGGNKEWMRPICFVGRNSLWFYLGSTVFLMGLFFLINLIIGG